MVIAIQPQPAWQADVAKICRVKTHSSTITDLLLLGDCNLGLPRREEHGWLETAKAWTLLPEFCTPSSINRQCAKECMGE